jgi:DNA-directed RNA polymerase specialized sigma54-like protein
VGQALRRLRTLDPEPGLRFAREPSEVIVPDVIVRKVGQDYHSGLASTGGEMRSSLTVKDHIKKLVAAEDPAHPLTDQQLAERLGAESIKIVRQAVAKYRCELKLPSANRRRRGPER